LLQERIRMSQKSEDNKSKDVSGFVSQIKEREKELFDFKLEHKLGKLKNTSKIKVCRRSIARLKTKQNLAQIVSNSVHNKE